MQDAIVKNMGKNKKILLLKDCLDQVPKGVRLMALDVGAKTIGMAVSDASQSLATPVGTIKRTKFSKDMEALAGYIKEFEIGGFILGWPVQMDGRQGARCDMIMSFADEMPRSDIFKKPPFIALFDERLSTQTVDNFLDNRVDMGKKSKRGAKEKGLVDALAAQVILQGALDGLS